MAWWNFVGGPLGPVRKASPDAPGRDLIRGHPTAPGPRDSYVNKKGTADGMNTNGIPGLPRLRPMPYSQGPGIPGETPTGPRPAEGHLYNEGLND